MRRKLVKRLRNIRKNKLEYLFTIILSIVFIVFLCSVFYFLGVSWEIFLDDARKEILITAFSIVITAFFGLLYTASNTDCHE